MGNMLMGIWLMIPVSQMGDGWAKIILGTISAFNMIIGYLEIRGIITI